jgi:hypothetical protein
MTDAQIHKVLASFGPTTLALLKRQGFFRQPYEALPAAFWRKLARESRKKNEAVFDLLFESVSKPELERIIKKLEKQKAKELKESR